MTEDAIRRYQQNRGQPQSGKVDRELLERLRSAPIRSHPCGPRAIASANGWTYGNAKTTLDEDALDQLSLRRHQSPEGWTLSSASAG
jgi:hypothetical protein